MHPLIQESKKMLKSEEALLALKILFDLNISKVKATYSLHTFDKATYHGDEKCLHSKDKNYLEALQSVKSYEEELIAYENDTDYEDGYEDSNYFYQGSNSNFLNAYFNSQASSSSEADYLKYQLERELYEKRRDFETQFFNRQLRDREQQRKEKLRKKIKAEDFTLIELKSLVSKLCPDCFTQSRRTGYDRTLHALLRNVLAANEVIGRVERDEKIETLNDSFNLFQSVLSFNKHIDELKRAISTNRSLNDPFLIEILEPYIKISKAKTKENVKFIKSAKAVKAFREERIATILKNVKFPSFNEKSIYPDLDAIEKTYMETLENTLNSNTKVSVIATSALHEIRILDAFTYKVLETQYDLSGCLTILPFEIIESLDFRQQSEIVTLTEISDSEFEIMKVLYSEKTYQSLKEIYEISSTI